MLGADTWGECWGDDPIGAWDGGSYDWAFGGYPMNVHPEVWYRICLEVEAVVTEYVLTELRKRPAPTSQRLPGGYVVGWSQPPRPADVIVSFDPRASKRDQARAVLYDYYHDDPLRYWSDNEAVKRCFGVKTKEDHDPLALISAYEDPKNKVWQCHGTGMTWKDLDTAVQAAIAHRRKLGPLPKSTYDKYPVVIYYYDNDKMKRITYPGPSVPAALNPSNTRWWAWGMGDSSDAGKAAGMDDVHTRETDDPKKIAVERENPGWVTKAQKQALKQRYPWISDMDSGSAGDWTNEQFQWDKDVAGTGVIGSITGAILALVSAVLDVTGVGAIIGVPLGIATPFVVAAINATDTALHAGDFGAALANLGPAIAQAAISAVGKGAGAAGVQIPPAAMQALGGTVTAISKAVQAGQQKKLDFAQIWQDVAKKAGSYKTLGIPEVEAIASMLAGPKGQAGGSPGTAGHVFIQGYLAGRYLDMTALAGIAKILQAYATFADPRIINIALLGMGIGHVASTQGGSTTRTSGHFSVHGDLESFVVGVLYPRYGLSRDELVGFECPPGFEAVATDAHIACAFRGKASCLAGVIDERGQWVCTTRDFDCPPGMETRKGSPSNWCFPMGAGGAQSRVGQTAPPPPSGPPDWSFPALGCPHGYWRDDLSGGICRPVAQPLQQPPPRTGYYAGDFR
jgi:hypothetical protein